MVVSQCAEHPGKCSDCEEVVMKKGKVKPGDERKTKNRRNRYTMIDKDDTYE